MKWRKLLAVAIVVALVAVLVLCVSSGKEDTLIKKTPFDSEIESTKVGDTYLVENSNYVLALNEVTMGVTLKDKQTGKVYGTNPVDEGGIQYDELGLPIKRHSQLESVLFIKYLNTKTNNTDESISYVSAVTDGRVVFEKTESGVNVNYYFDDAEIMIPVNYTLREDGVALSINPDNIQENDNMLLSVSVAPFFCSVKNDDNTDGYLLYPSGSGALVYPKKISASGETYSAEVYGMDASKEIWDKVTTEKNIKLPVLGAKFGEQAVFGIIENGAEASLLDMKVGSTSIGYSSVYVTYQVRGFTENIKELYNNRFYKGNVYSENTVTAPLTVCYYPLAGEDANYNAMAELYRDYLNETAGEVKADKASTLDISMVGGAMVKKSFVGIPYETLLATTTLSDVNDITKDLLAAGIKVSNLSLLGFGESGINSYKLAGNFKVDGALGGTKGLSTVLEECKNNGIGIYFDFDIVKFAKTGNGYDSYFSAAIRANKKVAKMYEFDIAVLGRVTESSYSLLARKELPNAAADVFETAKKWNLGGVGFSSLSSIAYSDYSDKVDGKYYAKSGLAAQVTDIYAKAGVNTMANDANVYAAANANLTLNIPTISTQSYLFDEDIPFYAMALRGRTAISGESMNLVTDPSVQLLRCVESGAGLAYTLTNNYSTELLDVNSPYFYNSLYGDLKDDIKANYDKVSAYYEKIGNSEIVGHIIHENGLRETVFANGVSVFVNYTGTDLVSDAGTVSANSFLVGEAKS